MFLRLINLLWDFTNLLAWTLVSTWQTNTRPIDLVMELFEMLREDKLYGQPGTDGTVASNVLESIKNDNDIWSCFMLNLLTR